MENPPRTNWIIMACSSCGQDWDDWHEARTGKAVILPCRISRRLRDWLRKAVAG